MAKLVVVNNSKNWPLKISGVEVVAAKKYLSDPRHSEIRGATIFNLCRSYRYQSVGYYVSLLAEARGHRAIPSVLTLQDLRLQSIVRVVSEDLDELIQRSLAPLESDHFTLSVYFSQNMAKRYTRLANALFSLFGAPLLRAEFTRQKGAWQLQQIVPIAMNDVPDRHREFLYMAAKQYFRSHRRTRRRPRQTRYDLAILYDPEERDPPSDAKALKRFGRAAESLGMATELITKEDYNRLAEFDALFIRSTTYVNHYTYRFSRSAAAQGLVVIDDPESIIRCTNKVYLAEILPRHGVPIPATVIVHRDNVDDVAYGIAFPCVLKRPDSSFSQGVIKVEDADEFLAACQQMLVKSDLLIAQEFIPTDYDWRVGVLDGRALYVCKYYMAWKHWQILKKDSHGRLLSGQVETIPIDRAPSAVIRTALRATKPIGQGLYGVDLKQIGRRYYVMEVNDNPSIEAGYEDRSIGVDLYKTVMRSILRRIEKAKER